MMITLNGCWRWWWCFYDNESKDVAADKDGKTNTWHSLADLAVKSIITPSSLSAAVYLIETNGMLEYDVVSDIVHNAVATC